MEQLSMKWYIVECTTCSVRKIYASYEEVRSFLKEHKGHDRFVQEIESCIIDREVIKEIEL